jgi:hypothetical protein
MGQQFIQNWAKLLDALVPKTHHFLSLQIMITIAPACASGSAVDWPAFRVFAIVMHSN